MITISAAQKRLEENTLQTAYLVEQEMENVNNTLEIQYK